MSFREVQDLTYTAERLTAEGDVSGARDLLVRAARMEWEFVQALAPERVRSRAIYGMASAAGARAAAARRRGRACAQRFRFWALAVSFTC